MKGRGEDLTSNELINKLSRACNLTFKQIKNFEHSKIPKLVERQDRRGEEGTHKTKKDINKNQQETEGHGRRERSRDRESTMDKSKI